MNRELTAEEHAYRRGALQALEYILADVTGIQSVLIIPRLAQWQQALLKGRDDQDVIYLGKYLDEVTNRLQRNLDGTFSCNIYAVGIEQKPNSFDMLAGPTPNLNDMLAWEGEDKAVIWLFMPDGTQDIIHRWKDGKWVVEEGTTP